MSVYSSKILHLSNEENMSITDDIVTFHNKGNVYHDADDPFKARIAAEIPFLIELENLDHELTPFHHDLVDCRIEKTTGLRRGRSATTFSEEKLDFNIVKVLLNDAFAEDEDKHRPYPSGGALYPVSVVCGILDDRILNSPESGVYQYRMSLQALQKLRLTDAMLLRKTFFNDPAILKMDPHFFLVYFINLPKVTVKYRYRAYRFSLMEVGSMYQQADLVGKKLGLSNRIYGGLADHRATKFCYLDRRTQVPAVLQLFGKKKD